MESISFEAPLVTELKAVTDGQNMNGSRVAGPWTSDAGQHVNVIYRAGYRQLSARGFHSAEFRIIYCYLQIGDSEWLTDCNRE